MAEEQPGLNMPPTELTGLDSVANPYGLEADSSFDVDAELAAYDAWSKSLVGNIQPQVDTGPQVFYSPSTENMFVNGALFNREDYQSALDSISYLDRPPAPVPTEVATDWQRVDPDNYGSYIKNIKDPSLGTQFARNIEIGGSVLKLLGGRTLQYFGAEETGQSFVDKAVEEMYHNQPFQREFTEIDVFENEGGHGAIDWFVSNLAQQGPMILFSMATALGGAVAVPTSVASTVGLGIASIMGRQTYQKAVVDAANKYIVQGAKGLTKGEKKLLREVSALAGVAKIKNPKIFVVDSKGAAKLSADRVRNREARERILTSGAVRTRLGAAQQARTGGAATGLLAGNLGIGIGDIYGEVRETGVGDRGTVALAAPFYALMETLPEFVLGLKIFGVQPGKMKHGKNLGKLAQRAETGRLLPGGRDFGVTGRVVKGFTIGGTLEGATELGQELLLMKSTDQDILGSQEQTNRLVNSFAAGFGVGGVIGGAANIFTREQINKKNLDNNDPTNLLGNNPTEPGSTSSPAPGGKGSNVLNNAKAYEMRPQSAPATTDTPGTPAVTTDTRPEEELDQRRRGEQILRKRAQDIANRVPDVFNENPGFLLESEPQFRRILQGIAQQGRIPNPQIPGFQTREEFINAIPELIEYHRQNKRTPSEVSTEQPVYDDADVIPDSLLQGTPTVIPKEVTNRLKQIQDNNRKRLAAPIIPEGRTDTPQQVDTSPPAEPTLQDRMTARIAEVIRPTAKKYLKKEQVKTKVATQFIGDGAPNSSSLTYKNMYAAEGLANTGRYTADDVVFVASNGKRKNRVNPVKDGKLQGVYENLDDAIRNGATIIMDTVKDTVPYNTGEIALAKYLLDAGYERQGKSGTWKPGKVSIKQAIERAPNPDEEPDVAPEEAVAPETPTETPVEEAVEEDVVDEAPAEETVDKKGDKLKAKPIKITDPTDPRYKLKVVRKGREVGNLNREELANASTKITELLKQAEGGFFFNPQGVREQKEKLDKDKAAYKNLVLDETAINAEIERQDQRDSDQPAADKIKRDANRMLRRSGFRTDQIGRFGGSDIATAAANIANNDLQTDRDIILEATSKTEFAPAVQNLRDRRTTPDLKVKKLANDVVSKQLVSNNKETDIVLNKINKFKEIDYVQKNRGNITPQGLVDAYGVKTLSNIMLTGKQFIKPVAAHHNGGIIIDSQHNYGQPITPNVIAHELGHASHSLNGAEIDAIENIELEMLRIQEYLYPGLEDRVLEAIDNNENVDIEFFNYLLSGNELIAEFNVNRLLDPTIAEQTAPNVAKILKESEKDPNLVRRRLAFPNGYNEVIRVNESFINKENPDGLNYGQVNAFMPGGALRKFTDNLRRETNANQKQSSVEMVTGEQARTDRPTDERNKEKSTRTGGAQVSGTKTPAGKAALQDKAQGKAEPRAKTGKEQITQSGVEQREVSVSEAKKAWNDLELHPGFITADEIFLRRRGQYAFPTLIAELNSYVADGTLNEIAAEQINELSKTLEIVEVQERGGKPVEVATAAFKPEREFASIKYEFDLGLSEDDTERYAEAANNMLRYAFFATDQLVGQSSSAIRSFRPDLGMSFEDYALSMFNQSLHNERSKLERSIIEDEFVRLASLQFRGNTHVSVGSRDTREKVIRPLDKNNKNVRSWFNFAVQNNLLKQIQDSGVIIGRVKTKDKKDSIEVIVDGDPFRYKPFKTGFVEKNIGKTSQRTIITENQIMEAIDKVKYDERRISSDARNKEGIHHSRIVRDVEEAYADPGINKDYRHLSEDGPRVLKDYFDDKGKAKLIRVGPNRYEFTTKNLTDKEKAEIAKRRNDKIKEGNFKRVDSGQAITEPMAKGKIDLIVKQMVRKLSVKPKITIVENVEELRTKHPKLFVKARKGRAFFNDDFESTTAAGYSIGDNIILFSEFIGDEKQLKFIIGHEVLGHYGFRVLAPASRLRNIFQTIYENDVEIRGQADQNIEKGMDKFEAIEEALADKAATMNTFSMKELWNLIKAWFRKVLGYPNMDDELSRYFISQASRNIRNGGGSVISTEQFKKNLRNINRGVLHGRYSEGSATSADPNLATKFFASMPLNKYTGTTYNSWSRHESFQDFAKEFITEFGKGDAGVAIGQSLEALQSLNNKAVKSYGLRKVFDLFSQKTALVRRLQQVYEGMMSKSLEADINVPFINYNIKRGATDEQKNQAGELAAYANLYLSRTVTDADIRNAVDDNGDGIIYVDETGEPRVNLELFESLKEKGKLTREQFAEGIEITFEFNPDGSENVTPTIYKPEFEITDEVWDIYNEMRNTIDESSKDIVLHTILAATDDKKQVLQNFKDTVGQPGDITDADIEGIKQIMQTYEDLYNEGRTLDGALYKYKDERRVVEGGEVLTEGVGINKARMFIREVQRAIAEDAKLNEDWKGDGAGITDKKGLGDYKGVFNKDMMIGDKKFEYASIVKTLERLNNIYKNDPSKSDKAYKITNAIMNVHQNSLKSENADFYARRTILTGYVPFNREGDIQVALRAYNKNGERVRLSEDLQSSIPYFQVRSNNQAKPLAKELQEIFPADQTYTVVDETGNEVPINFRVETEEASKTSSLQNQMPINEFMGIITRLNINLKPADREKVTKALTSVESKARKGLRLSGNPGWDVDVLTGVARHLESSAHVAGKAFFQNRISNLIADQKNWTGDRAKLDALQDTMLAAEKSGNSARIKEARKKYDIYANQYKYMAPKPETVTIYNRQRVGTKVNTLGRGNRYKDDAARLLAFYEQAAGEIDVSSEDLLAKSPIGSKLKLFTVLTQLGGSLAAGLANITSLPLHAQSYLAFYNDKKGYGGGFGMPKTSYEIARALKHMSDPIQSVTGQPNIADYSFTQKLAKDNSEGEVLRKKYNLSLDEAQALNEVTGQGVLQAAQFNALVGTARGGIGNTVQSYFIKKYMAPFSYTEQLNRRVTFLAAYRMQKERLIASGGTLNQELRDAAIKFANKAVVTSQGDYALYNRPSLIRGNLAQYLFVYKQFLVITIENYANMDVKGKLYFAALLLLFSGVKGIPFAEDFRDLLNTLLQKAGAPFGMIDVEKELYDMFEDIIPGSGNVMMRGVFDSMGTGTFSTRLGFGDMIPGTGILLAGDQSHEIANAAGPMWSFFDQAVTAGSNLASYSLESIGLKSDRTEFVDDILRKQPFGAIRGVADAFTYMEDGKIIHPDGKVLTEDVSTGTIIARALNFFPASVNFQYDIIRYGQQSSKYINTIRQGFAQDYIKARLEDDTETMDRVVAEVEDWNNTYEGTELYLRNWLKNTNRQYKLLKLPAVQRYLKTAPTGIRPEVSRLEALFGENIKESE